MDNQLEKIIVNSFFNKRFQDRVLFELSSIKKRKDAIGRLSHNYIDVLNDKYMIAIPKPNSDSYEIAELLKKYGAGDTCYVISFYEDIDGKHLPLPYALEKAVGSGMPTLISFIPNKLAYLECEQEYGSPPRYILKKD